MSKNVRTGDSPHGKMRVKKGTCQGSQFIQTCFADFFVCKYYMLIAVLAGIVYDTL